jgi:predicted nucleic acid-binding Zn ribbon protein
LCQHIDNKEQNRIIINAIITIIIIIIIIIIALEISLPTLSNSPQLIKHQ